MKKILKELVEAQKEANRISGAVLAIWEKIEERNFTNNQWGYAHYLASSLSSIKYLREEYLALVDALYKEPDSEVIQEAIDDVVCAFRNITLEISPRKKLSYQVMWSEDLVKKIKEEKR